jgi:hypothetical protein
MEWKIIALQVLDSFGTRAHFRILLLFSLDGVQRAGHCCIIGVYYRCVLW